ncbi:MAG TPA: tetratricopeptide repeat protein [Anaerolineaceae bacterium]|nr:tetratricopeptide repeat protein [Anaerolineaceae bacterium]
MTASEFIINVNEADFEYEVLSYSQNTPVLVDFWAPWCQPCKLLDPILEKLILEANGNLRLARVNTDDNPNLAIRYGVHSLPTVKAFSQGQVVSEFVGLQPEPRLRELLGKIMPPSPANLAVEKANSMLFLHQYSSAEKMFREILEQHPDLSSAQLGLSKTLLHEAKVSEALELLHSIPASREFSQAEILLPFAIALKDFQAEKLADETDLDTAFKNSIRLASRGNLPAALDGLLDILRQDRHYHSDRARLVVLGLLELLGEEDPQTRQYRSELASVLF